MRQARGLGQVVVIELEGRCDRGIEDDQLVAQDLDLAAAQGAVVGALRATPDLADHLHAELVADALGGLEHLRAVGVADHLGKTCAIAQIDEDDATMVAAPGHPAEKRDNLVEMIE